MLTLTVAPRRRKPTARRLCTAIVSDGPSLTIELDGFVKNKVGAARQVQNVLVV